MIGPFCVVVEYIISEVGVGCLVWLSPSSDQWIRRYNWRSAMGVLVEGCSAHWSEPRTTPALTFSTIVKQKNIYAFSYGQILSTTL